MIGFLQITENFRQHFKSKEEKWIHLKASIQSYDEHKIRAKLNQSIVNIIEG